MREGAPRRKQKAPALGCAGASGLSARPSRLLRGLLLRALARDLAVGLARRDLARRGALARSLLGGLAGDLLRPRRLLGGRRGRLAHRRNGRGDGREQRTAARRDAERAQQGGG